MAGAMGQEGEVDVLRVVDLKVDDLTVGGTRAVGALEFLQESGEEETYRPVVVGSDGAEAEVEGGKREAQRGTVVSGTVAQ